MSHGTQWIPEDVDDELPSAARIYDYVLGGGHNFAVDRRLAERLLEALPARDIARMNRQYLRRAVLYLLDQGITQFLDLGSGIPTVGNVHEIVQRVNPDGRVLYVDNESVAVAHGSMILDGNPNAAVIYADMRDPDSILNSPTASRLLDLSLPLGVLMVGVLQFIPAADDPWAMIGQYRHHIASGSYLALSVFTADIDPVGMGAWVEVFKDSRDPIHPHTFDEVIRLFAGFDLVEPGVVLMPEWRPEHADIGDAHEDARRANLYAGVARKP